MALYDTKNDLFSYVKVTGKRIPNSVRWELSSKVNVIDPVVYSSSSADKIRIVMEIFYFAALASLLIRELYELRVSTRQYGKFAGILLYAADFGNMVDCGNYALQIMSIIAWLNFALMTAGWNPSLECNVLADKNAKHNIWKAGDGMSHAMQTFYDIENFSLAITLHKTLTSLSLVMCCIQMVKNLVSLDKVQAWHFMARDEQQQ